MPTYSTVEHLVPYAVYTFFVPLLFGESFHLLAVPTTAGSIYFSGYKSFPASQSGEFIEL